MLESTASTLIRSNNFKVKNNFLNFSLLIIKFRINGVSYASFCHHDRNIGWKYNYWYFILNFSTIKRFLLSNNECNKRRCPDYASKWSNLYQREKAYLQTIWRRWAADRNSRHEPQRANFKNSQRYQDSNEWCYNQQQNSNYIDS